MFYTKEQWRDVPGYEGLYQISIDTKEGRCRRFFKNGNVKELSNTPNKKSRIYWDLAKNNIKNNQQAAVWIALTFPELIENEYFEGAEIDHKDTDKLNNQPSNLRWVTRKGNMNNPLTRNDISKSMEGRLVNRPDQSKRVFQYTLDGKYVNDYPSVSEAARQTNIRRSCISKCCLGLYRVAGPFVWAYNNNL